MTSWISNGHSGIKTVMYFTASVSVATQRAELNELWMGLDGVLDEDTSWSIDITGRELDDATGTLTGAWNEGTTYTGIGGVTGESVPDLAQMLIRWRTANVVAGRFLVGRTFVPGLSTQNLVDGNISPPALGPLAAVGQAFVDGGANFGVWHRPQLPPGTPPSNPDNLPRSGGDFVNATSCDVWGELAAQRRRRR